MPDRQTHGHCNTLSSSKILYWKNIESPYPARHNSLVNLKEGPLLNLGLNLINPRSGKSHIKLTPRTQVCLFHALWTLTLLTIIIGMHIGCSVRLEKPIRETQTPLTGLLSAVKGLILLSEGCICLLWSVFHNNCESFCIESVYHTVHSYINFIWIRDLFADWYQLMDFIWAQIQQELDCSTHWDYCVSFVIINYLQYTTKKLQPFNWTPEAVWSGVCIGLWTVTF